MDFKTAIESLKEGFAVSHLSMNIGCYVKYNDMNNSYTIYGDKSNSVDYSIMDSIVFFEIYCIPQFDSNWSIWLDDSPKELLIKYALL